MRAFEQRKPNNPDNSSFFGPKIQKKLKTGTVGDKYEVEADHVADKVVNNNSSGGGLLQSKQEVQQKTISETITSVQAKDMKEEESVQKKSDKKEEEKPVQKKEKEEEKPVQKKEEPIQAKCADCEKEDKVQKKDKEEEKTVQKKEKNTESEIQNNELEGKLVSSRGGGTGLDKKTKGEMESGFGADFSNVKIHTDSNAVNMSQELGAQAFTNGNDVYFNEGKYNPDSKEGKHLLAHELTHTVQQTGMVQKSAMEDHPENLQNPEDPFFKGNPPLEKANDNEMLITSGHKGGYVAEIQTGLLEWRNDSLPNFGADGDFGSETRNAVLDFQIENELRGKDGIVGPETMGTLDNVVVEEKGGKKENKCLSFVPINEKAFPTERRVAFDTTIACPTVNIKMEVTAHEINFHSCSELNIRIDDAKRTRRTIKIDRTTGKGQFDETFTLKHHEKRHELILSMPEDCRGDGDRFTATGKITRI